MKFALLLKYYVLILVSISLGFFGFCEYQNLRNNYLNFNEIIDSENINQEGYLLEIYPSESFKSVLRRLRDNKIISASSHYTLYFMSKLAKHDKKIKAGEYLITRDTTGWQLMRKIVKGQVYLHKFTIVEGTRFEQLLKSIQVSKSVKNTLSKHSCKDVLQAMGRWDSNSFHVAECEGLFMPDTYAFPKNTTDVALLQRAYDVMQTRLDYLWDNSSRGSLKSKYEALIMASVIEKETSLIEEMGQVSGVYHKRLKNGIPLQADPTVIYGLKIFNRPLTRADLKKVSKYNTYLNKGLPPSPIATPSVAALFAALNPEEANNYLYFVADGTGKHIFSNSLLDHNKAIFAIKNANNFKIVNKSEQN
jgi:UPF0755 protein